METMKAPFEQLFMDEYQRVVAVAYRVVADRAEAEDIAQEVFWDFHRRYPEGTERARGWLHAAAVHSALNAIRSRRRRWQREAGHAQLRAWDPPDQRSDPELAFEETERRRQLRTALARLPERSATVLALRYGGLSYAEVATALGVGIGQVGTLLRRAEISLRKELPNDTSD